MRRDAVGAGEGAEVARAVLGDVPRDVYLREVLRVVDLDERVALVVLQPGVVGRLVLLDQVALEDDGLRVRLGHDEVEVGDAGDHVADLELEAPPARRSMSADGCAGWRPSRRRRTPPFSSRMR